MAFTHNSGHTPVSYTHLDVYKRQIYTTNSVESYHRQLRKVMKTKAAFPTPEAARKLLYLCLLYTSRQGSSLKNATKVADYEEGVQTNL